MTDDKLNPFIDRLDAARADYGAALAEIMQDAIAAGVKTADLLPDVALRAWAVEQSRKGHGSIYFAKVVDLPVVKVGFSIAVPDRMRALRTEHKRDFEVLGTVAGTMADERWFHSMLYWCRDYTLPGREFFSFPVCRGLVRIFIANADRFPFTAEQKDSTRAWIDRARSLAFRKHADRDQAKAVLGDFFERTAAEHCRGAA